MRSRYVIALVAVAVMVSACGGGDDSEARTEARDALVADMMADGISPDTALCFADEVLDEFGLDELEKLGEGNDPSPEVALRAFELLTECGFSLEDAGFPDDVSDFRDLASPRDEVDGPYTYGDDDDFDALWDACEEGSGTACDDLFFQSPIGSEYEAFGNTCGNRLELDYDCSSLGG